jgi:hypothetical protein
VGRPATVSGVLRSVGRLVAFALVLQGAGCYSQIIDAVVDDVTDPGGMMTITIDGGMPGTLPGLAQGNPLAITAQSASLVIALTCNSDPGGASAATVLSMVGGQIALTIQPMNGNRLQVHAGGKSFVADAGTISLQANSDGSISGSYDTTGTVMGDGTPITMTGTLTSIPQQK